MMCHYVVMYLKRPYLLSHENKGLSSQITDLSPLTSSSCSQAARLREHVHDAVSS